MPTYDKTKIGKWIAWGGDHFVYEYGAGQVIKFSGIDYFFGKKGREKSLRDYAVCKRYLGEYVLNTEFVTSVNGKHVAKLQPKVVGHSLTKKDMARSDIERQLTDLVQKYDLLLKQEGEVLDLIGRGGIFRRTLSNIFVDAEDKLYLIDTTLLVAGDIPLLQSLIRIFLPACVWRQSSTIKMFSAR